MADTMYSPPFGWASYR